MKHIIFFLLVTVILVSLLWWALPHMEITKWDAASIIRLLLIGTMLSGSILFLYRRQAGKALQHILIWVTIALVCVGLYASKNAIIASLVPGSIQHKETDVLAIRAAADGHFYIHTMVNGKPVRFMIDTGASSITLPISTAKRVGLSTDNLAFTQPFQTANGQVFGAPTTLETLDIGGHVFEYVPAYVNQGELKTPLMGIRFLDRAKSLEIRDDELIIRF